ncbi:hypothetical protein SteCoe_33390 [Stentor coeruleus]|uniref:Ion transport domain-containing protein n=1 Tax=Stentor coeruleus TaxID=5963 RepID=A0A1R2AWU6_9CILI|nr:hypothetical protein SteCoe_33390 [Stentor coeruleus]
MDHSASDLLIITNAQASSASQIDLTESKLSYEDLLGLQVNSLRGGELKGHLSPINCVDLSCLSNLIASSDNTNKIKIWDLISRKNTITITEESLPINIYFMQNGSHLLVILKTGVINVWNALTGSLENTFKSQFKLITASAMIEGCFNLALAGENKIQIVKSNTLDIECEFIGHTGKINCLSFVSNSYLVVSGSADSTIKIWNFSEKCEICTLEGHEAEIKSLAVSSDGSLIMSFSTNSSMILWDLSSKTQIFKNSSNKFYINSMVFTENSEKIIMACNEHSVKFWDVNKKHVDHAINQGQGSVKAIAITPSCETIIAGYDDFKLRILSVQDKRCESNYNLGDFELNCADITNDYNYLAAGGKDGSLTIWNMAKNKLYKKVHFNDGYFNLMEITADNKILVAGGGNGEVNIYNIEKKKLVYSIKAHSATIWGLAITPNQKYIVSGGEDLLVKVWKLSDKSEKRVFEGHSDCINTVDSTSDSKYIISGSEDCLIKVWNLKSKEEVFTLNCESKVFCVKWYEPKKWIISGSRDYLIRLWDFNTQSVHNIFKGHTSTVRCLFISVDNQYLVSCGYDSMVFAWNLEEEKEIFSIDGNCQWLRSICMTSDNKNIIASGGGSMVKAWKFEDQNIVFNAKVNSASTRCISLTRDDKYLIASGNEGSIRIIDYATKQEYAVLHQMPNQINSLKFSSKFNFIAAGHENSSVYIYYIKTKKSRITLIGHVDKVNCIQLMSSDKYVVSGSSDNTIKIWNILTRVCENTFTGHTASVVSLAISQDNSLIASGSADFSIRLWNFSKRILECILLSHANVINSLVFSNCGRYLYSACSYKSIVAWNIIEKKEEFKLQGQLSNVACLALSADKKHIISGNNKSIVFWNIDAKKEEYELLGHFGLINFIAITPDSKTVYSVSQDCSAKKWSLIPKRMKIVIERTKSEVNFLASNSEWAHFYTGTVDGYFKIYSSKTFELKDDFFLCKKGVQSVYVSDDESMGVCGCQNGSTYIFSFGQNTDFYKFNKQSKRVNMVCLSIDKTKLITAAENKVFNLWDIKTKNLEREFIGHRAKVNHAKFLKNRNCIISSSDDWRVKLWNIETGIDEHTLTYGEITYYMAINPEESLLAVASGNCEISILNLNNLSETFHLRGHSSSVCYVAFSKSNTLVSGGGDCSVILWDIKEKNMIRQFKFNTDSIYCVGFASENLIIATSIDNTMKIFDADTGKQVITPHNSSGNITAMVTLYTNNLLINCSDLKTLNFYDIGKSIDSNTFFTSFIGNCICASNDEKKLYIGTSDGEIYEFDIEMQKLEQIMKEHSSSVSDICLMEGISTIGSNLLVSASEDKTINIWNLDSKALEFTFHGHTRSINEVSLVGKKTWIVSCSSDKTVRLWDIEEKKELFIFTGHTAAVLCVTTTSDGIYAISGSEDHSIRVWNLETLRLDTLFIDHQSSVTSILSCKGSEFIVSGDNEGHVFIWNLLDKRCEYKMPSLSFPIKKIMSTPSNDKLIVAYKTKMSIVPIKLDSNTKTMMKKKYSSEDDMFEIEFSDGVISNIKSFDDNKETLFWEPADNYDNVVQDLASFYSVIDAVKLKTYSCSENAAEITFTKSKYTLAHIFAYYGQTAYLRNIMNHRFVLKTDIFRHSPVYYGIVKQYQTCVDVILDYLISNASKADSLNYQSSVYALRNDFCLLIRNSSSMLHMFLQNLLVSSKSVFMKTSTRIPEFRFDNHSIPIYKDFLNSMGQENLVKLQYIPFSLPYILGSNECINFGESLVDCENNAIFSTPAIQYFIQYQWDSLYYWVAGNSMLLFLNLVFLIFVICFGNEQLFLVIIFLCINVLLFLWEFVQLFSSGLSYFGDIWNLMDTCRLISTFTYIIFEFYREDYPYLSFIMIILNFVRGLTAFRMFDGTRFYVNLILRSIKAMFNFFIMFTYSTFTLSLLFIVSREQKSIDFNNLWMDSYSLNFGGYEVSSENYPTLESIVFIIGTLLNVVLMLNLLISILGDSYSEFQEEKYEIDYRLKAELTLEIQGMFFWVGSSNEKKVFQILTSPIEEGNTEGLDQKIKNLDKNLHSINSGQSDISEKMKSNLNIITGKIDGIENRVLALEDKIGATNISIENLNQNMQEILKLLREKKD